MALPGPILAAASAVALAVGPPLLDAPAPAQPGGAGDAALVVGVADYAFAADVPFADRDAQAFASYLLRTRQVPPERVRILLDDRAAREDIEAGLDYALGKVEKGGTLWVYFAGHGVPAPSGDDGLLAGVDVKQTAASVTARSVSRRWLLGKLEKGRAARTVVLLDACFSGRSRAGAPIVEGLRPMVPVRDAPGAGKVLVFSAASGDEVSGPYPAARQGLFTYFAVGGLRGWADLDGDAKVTAAELSTYVSRGVASILADGSRSQSPRANLAEPDPRGGWTLAQGAAEKGPDLAALVLAGTSGGAAAGGLAGGGGPASPAPTKPPALAMGLPALLGAQLDQLVVHRDSSGFVIADGAGVPITENEFVRRYARTTGSAELAAHETRRNTGTIVGWCTAAAATGGLGAWGIASYADVSTSTGGVQSASDVWPILAGSLGVSAALVALPVCIGQIASGDGSPYDHELSERDARRHVERYNEALQQELQAPAQGAVRSPAGGVRFAAGPAGASVELRF